MHSQLGCDQTGQQAGILTDDVESSRRRGLVCCGPGGAEWQAAGLKWMNITSIKNRSNTSSCFSGLKMQTNKYLQARVTSQMLQKTAVCDALAF
jgi:hypothetical protein